MAENTKIIISAVDKTKKGFGSVGRALGGLTKSIFSMRTALVGVAGVAGFGYLIKSSLNATDSLKKTADKIGTTTEALSKLRYAADLTGISTTTMDMALQRFTRRTAEAAKGTGEAKGALKALGLNARALVDMPLDQRMLALADAFAEETNEAQKLALAFKLFDSEGAALVVTLGKGREGLKEMFGEAKALGIVMSGDAAEGVEDANDALTKLATMFKGITNQVVAKLAPAIEALATAFKDKLLKAIDDSKGGIDGLARSLASNFIEGAIKTVRAVETIGNAVIGMYNTMISARAEWDRIRGVSSFAALKKDLEIVDEMLATKNPLDRFRFFGEGGIAEWWDTDELNAKREELVASMAVLEALGKGSYELPEINLDGLIAVLLGTKQTVEEFRPVIESITEPLAGLDEKVKASTIVIGAMKQTFEDWQKTLPTLEEGMTSLTNNAMGAFTKGFTDAITGAEKFSDAMKAMAKSVIDSLIQMLVQYYITQQIFGAITSMFPTGGGNTPAPGSSSYSPGMAIGGSVQAGQNYMVGERGAEMFVPNQSGAIIPNNKLGGGGGGVVVNQTINVTTGIQSTVRAEIVQLMPQIAQAAKGAVADARLRGGNFSKAMAGA
jgi:hypothetical protein